MTWPPLGAASVELDGMSFARHDRPCPPLSSWHKAAADPASVLGPGSTVSDLGWRLSGAEPAARRSRRYPPIRGLDPDGVLEYISSCDEVTKGARHMRDFELAVKAIADPTRTRILKLLELGGLCVCQVQAVLSLAPSTVSKHLTILKLAGLVEDQRDGKWIEYRLTDQSHNPHSRSVLGLLRGRLGHDAAVISDRKRLKEVKAIPMTELCSLPAARVPMPHRPARARGARKVRSHG
jgi:arsenate reductase/ArsR family transcriptional regulator